MMRIYYSSEEQLAYFVLWDKLFEDYISLSFNSGWNGKYIDHWDPRKRFPNEITPKEFMEIRRTLPLPCRPARELLESVGLDWWKKNE